MSCFTYNNYDGTSASGQSAKEAKDNYDAKYGR
jgi:hypothetical protein